VISNNNIPNTISVQRQNRWTTAGLIVGCWTLVALFFSSRSYTADLYKGTSPGWWRTLVVWLIVFYLWAALTPLVIYLAKRFPLEGASRWRHLAVHLGASCGIVLFYILIITFVGPHIWWPEGLHYSFPQKYYKFFALQFQTELSNYWSIVGVSLAVSYYRKYQERKLQAAQLELKAAQLEASLSHAQLDALRMQLHPHFLFNTLNTISVLMRNDADAANRVLVRLSELLRLTLDHVGKHEVPLREELEFLQMYLEIEQTRFQDRLSVRTEIDPAALDALVPTLILQPLVENALRHGIAPYAKPGVIEVRAQKKGVRLELQVRDSGPGLRNFESAIAVSGIGLTNTRARLEQLYRDQHSLDLADATEGGLRVTVSLPFCTEQDSANKLETV
jgi:two-component system, LytTR family, sensor kinase